MSAGLRLPSIIAQKPVFHRVIAFGTLAENAATLAKGTAVTIIGEFADDSWTTETGETRRQVQLEAADIAVSLRFATAQITRNPREHDQAHTRADHTGGGQRWTTPGSSEAVGSGKDQEHGSGEEVRCGRSTWTCGSSTADRPGRGRRRSVLPLGRCCQHSPPRTLPAPGRCQHPQPNAVVDRRHSHLVDTSSYSMWAI
jgi:single-stranded DNA-binding protein